MVTVTNQNKLQNYNKYKYILSKEKKNDQSETDELVVIDFNNL